MAEKLVMQLKLPHDIITYICSFAFYTHQYIIKRNKKLYEDVMRQLKHVKIDKITTWGQPVLTLYIILPSKTLIVTKMCSVCNNYIKKIPNCACKC